MNANKIVIGVVGMPGAGKSLVVETAQKKGYSIVVMGDIVREETQKKGLELNPKNMGKVMLELREKGGNSIIAEKCLPKIEQNKNEKIIVDGIRSLSELDVFKKHFPKFTLVSVHSSPETRFYRLNYRGRSDDTKNWQLFRERDMRELGVGIGNAIAMAEYVITNENDKKETKAKIRETLRRIEEQWKT
jgi:dephospho-CoA kinase